MEVLLGALLIAMTFSVPQTRRPPNEMMQDGVHESLANVNTPSFSLRTDTKRIPFDVNLKYLHSSQLCRTLSLEKH
jgi:hypothetical protein